MKQGGKYAGRFLRIRNLAKYQHYRDRNPPWIKLHQDLLEDYDFGRLQDASKAQALCIMLLASRLGNRIPADPEWIAKKISATSRVDLDVLLNNSFLEVCEDASGLLADCKQSAMLEGEGEGEKSREENTPHTPPDGGAQSVSRAEMNWRVERIWADHLRQWERFMLSETGCKPPVPPTLTEEIRESIRAALLEHDRDLLAADKREQWERASKARAAGIGIFLDPWCTGRHKDNDAKNGGKRYLEHWRPWKKQRGKGDPVDRFAELYHHAKEAQRVASS